ncbi:MAG: shikimate dehydrogenase [Pseudonocardiales bacterium]|nr:MAG: shikimate dehydrogenase [Pseudonocardiales bacterium]
MPRAAVLGSPVAHSLSPALHRAAYAALGLSGWAYDAVECAEEGLAPFLDGLGPEWAGLSLTMPLKRVAIGLMATVSALARDVGAANTVLLSPDGRHADNTDVGGLVDALSGADASAAVVLGAGGTAAAALAALRDLGASGATVVVRDRGRARDLLAAADRLGMSVRLRRWPTVPEPASLVISTVPRGAADALGDHPWRRQTTVCDVLYDPWPTRLAAAAAAAGCRVVGGRELLLHQAARQVRLMTGRAAPVDAMRQAIALP